MIEKIWIEIREKIYKDRCKYSLWPSCTTWNEKRNLLLKPSNEDLRLRFLVQFPSVHVSLLVSINHRALIYTFPLRELDRNLWYSSFFFFYIYLLIFFFDRLKPSLSCLLESIEKKNRLFVYIDYINIYINSINIYTYT